ncbi:MAG: TraB/GumN family protein [Asticcacaulis sp.]
MTIISFVAALAAVLNAATSNLATPPDARTQDITEVVVRGRKLDWSNLAAQREKVPGPAIWKLSRGGSTVFVIAVLDEAPNGLTWDARFLKSQLSGASSLIVPGPTHYSDTAEKAYRKASSLTPPQQLKDVVSSQSWTRFSEAVAAQGFPLDRYAGFEPERAGAEMYDAALVKMGIDGDIGQLTRIADMAANGRLPIREAFRFDGDLTDAERLRLTAAQNETCLNAYLDSLGFDAHGLPRLAAAWADGDLDTVLRLYRDPPSQTCDLMTPDWPRYEAAAIGDTVTAIDDALSRPDKSVAVVTLSQLLRNGGVLDQLHARGVSIGE